MMMMMALRRRYACTPRRRISSSGGGPLTFILLHSGGRKRRHPLLLLLLLHLQQPRSDCLPRMFCSLGGKRLRRWKVQWNRLRIIQINEYSMSDLIDRSIVHTLISFTLTHYLNKGSSSSRLPSRWKNRSSR
jgi:hypothetical protein